MRAILVILMRLEIKRCKRDLKQTENYIVKKAKQHRLKVYESALLFLKIKGK